MKPPVVFIAGCGRSGTSYLRTLLDAHPEIYIPSESLFWVDYLEHGDVLPSSLLNWLFYREPQLLCWYEGDARPLGSARELTRHVSETMAKRANALIWGQKTPRFVRHMELFEANFPEARWILIYRDPRAVVASMLSSKQHTYSERSACNRWLRDNAPIIRELQRSDPADNVLVIRYENMIDQLQATLDRAFDFLGVARIDSQTLFEHARPVFFSRSRFEINTVRDSVQPLSRLAESWRAQLSPESVAYIEARCSEPMQLLGYKREAATHPTRPSAIRHLLGLLVLKEYLLKWPEYLVFTALRKTLITAFLILRRCRNFFRSS